MNAATTFKTLTNRQFVAMIRNRLDADGHTEIAIDRLWIDEDTEGYPFLLRVPVGSDLVVPLKLLDSFHECRDLEGIANHVGHFAKALVNLKRAEKMLVKYAEDMRRAARREIAAARAEGLDLVLAGVGFKPTYAFHLTHAAWKDAASHVLAEITVHNTSFYLRRETTELLIEEPEDVATELADLKREQRERQDMLARLDELGADLEVDAITLDLLEAHGQQIDDMLRRVWKNQHVGLTVDHLGTEAQLSLVSSEGKVTACLLLDEAIWNGEHLWFRDPAKLTEHGAVAGGTLGERISHPVLAIQPITQVDSDRESRPDLIHFDLSDKLLFDADSGRIWRPERVAA